LDIGDAPVLGDAAAPITIVEFMDYQCPFCLRFHLATFALLKRDYIDTGKVKFVNRDLPLTEIHPHALRAAQATRCAGDQGQYWPLRDQLQRSNEALELSNLLDHAAKLSLDLPTFRTCIEKEKYRSAIERDARQAMNWGVTATPSFVIGKSTSSGVDGEIVSGAVPYEALSARLKTLLGEPRLP
jgi:protein-disulfide isomerase